MSRKARVPATSRRKLLRTYKFVVRPIVHRVDDAGRITGEVVLDEIEMFGLDGLCEFADSFDRELGKLERTLEEGSP